MDVFEITDYKSGISQEGVNYLQPSDSFQKIQDGFIHRQVLQSRKGIGYYTPRLADGSRIMGIWEFKKPDGLVELLVADKNFLYSYNETTNVFDPIPFDGSMVGYAGFTIIDPESYVAGTAYPTKDNEARFVFTGIGISANAAGSAVFYYDGTDIRDFTNVVDNAEYAAPIEGALVRANHVFYFNERINFVVPSIPTALNQGVVYTGIRDASGNGDKFNVAGAGLIQFSTSELIKGAKIVGEDLFILLDESPRVLEITTDAFNPYRIRNIPAVLGTDAKYSAVAWNSSVSSIGKTGVLQIDARNSLRSDTRIPNFTTNRIDQEFFELTYGGFDRVNGHFLWTYKEDNLTDSETQDRVLVKSYEEGSWSVFNMRLTCLGETQAGQSLPWNQIESTAGNPSWDRWDTTEESWGKIGLGKYVRKTLAGDDLGFIYEINVDSDDYNTAISGISNASNAVLDVDASAFQVGDQVVVENVEGMTEINNFDPSNPDQVDINVYTVTAATPTQVTLNVDSSLFAVYTGEGKLSKPINFYAETIPLNPYRPVGKRIFISHAEFLMNTDSGSLKVDVYENEEQTPFIRDYVCTPTRATQGTEWVSMTVNNEASFMRFALKHLSPSNTFQQTSMRIHSEMGGGINE